MAPLKNPTYSSNLLIIESLTTSKGATFFIFIIIPFLLPLNPAPAAEVPMEVVEKVTYLTPNEHEAVLIFGNELSSEELLKKYAGKLLITQGSKGVSTCLETGEILTVPARPAKVVDTTGAGDTLNGAFSVQIANGADIKTALTFANTAASLSTEKFGAQTGMPTVSEVEKELQ